MPDFVNLGARIGMLSLFFDLRSRQPARVDIISVGWLGSLLNRRLVTHAHRL